MVYLTAGSHDIDRLKKLFLEIMPSHDIVEKNTFVFERSRRKLYAASCLMRIIYSRYFSWQTGYSNLISRANVNSSLGFRQRVYMQGDFFPPSSKQQKLVSNKTKISLENKHRIAQHIFRGDLATLS